MAPHRVRDTAQLLVPAPSPGGGRRRSLERSRVKPRVKPGTRASLKADGGAVQVVFVGALDLDGGDLADAQRAAAVDVDGAVDLGGVAFAAALGDGRADRVDEHLLAGSELALEPARGDFALVLHQAMPALFLDLCRD